MIHFSIKTERLLLFIILGLLMFNMLPKRCSNFKLEAQPEITQTKDTIWHTKIDTFKVQTVRYKTVYVHEADVNNIVDDASIQETPEAFKEAKVYQDTLSNDDIDIFSYSLLQGDLLDNQLSYTLKVPREVTITKTIEHPKTFRSGVYLFSEVGGNATSFNNLSLGLQYNRKGNWFASYRYNLNSVHTPTHNIGIGLRLFK